jgi:hypothetical protein
LGWLLRYFWFFAAAIMMLNVISWRRSLALLVADGTLATRDAERLTRGATVWLVGAPVLLGLIALAAGWPDPFCAGALSFSDLPSAATSLIMLASWAALLWWVWIGRGAELLGRLSPVMTRSPFIKRSVSPRTVRLVITGLVVWSAVGAALMWRRVPGPPADRCALSAPGRVTELGAHVAG